MLPQDTPKKHHMRVVLYRKIGCIVQYEGIKSLYTDSDSFAATWIAVRAAFPGCLIEDSWEVPLDYVPADADQSIAVAA